MRVLSVAQTLKALKTGSKECSPLCQISRKPSEVKDLWPSFSLLTRSLPTAQAHTLVDYDIFASILAIFCFLRARSCIVPELVLPVVESGSTRAIARALLRLLAYPIQIPDFSLKLYDNRRVLGAFYDAQFKALFNQNRILAN